MKKRMVGTYIRKCLKGKKQLEKGKKTFQKGENEQNATI
jgi:hypothetical protein